MNVEPNGLILHVRKGIRKPMVEELVGILLVIRSNFFIRLFTVEMIYIRCNSLIIQTPNV